MASESAAFAAAPPEAAAAEGDPPPPAPDVAAAKEPPRIRLLPRNSDDHRGDIAQFNKAAQVSGYLTDLDLYSSGGGAPVSVHRSILCDLSPWLARLLVDRECCKCQGKACIVGGPTASLTLAEVGKWGLQKAVELIYTGVCTLEGRAEADDGGRREVLGALQMLGVPVKEEALVLEETRSSATAAGVLTTPSTPSWATVLIEKELKSQPSTTTTPAFVPFENQSEMAAILLESGSSPVDISRKTGRRRKRKTFDDAEFDTSDFFYEEEDRERKAGSSCGRKRNDTVKEECVQEHPKEVAVVSIEKHSSKKGECPHCSGLFFKTGGWYYQHVARCTGEKKEKECEEGRGEEEMEEEDDYWAEEAIGDIVDDISRASYGKRKEEEDGDEESEDDGEEESFGEEQDLGATYHPHKKQAEESKKSRKKEQKRCPKCTELFFPNGFFRHVKYCAGATGNSPKPDEHLPQRRDPCPRCGDLFYVTGGFLAKHIAKCGEEDEERIDVVSPPGREGGEEEEDWDEIVTTSSDRKICKVPCPHCCLLFRPGSPHEEHVKAGCEFEGLRDQIWMPSYRALRCLRCGRGYSTHARRHVIQHYIECEGTMEEKRRQHAANPVLRLPSNMEQQVVASAETAKPVVTPRIVKKQQQPQEQTKDKKKAVTAGMIYSCRRCGKGFRRDQCHQYEGHMRHCKVGIAKQGEEEKRRNCSIGASGARAKDKVNRSSTPAKDQEFEEEEDLEDEEDGNKEDVDSPYSLRRSHAFDPRQLGDEAAARLVDNYRSRLSSCEPLSCYVCGLSRPDATALMQHVVNAHLGRERAELLSKQVVAGSVQWFQKLSLLFPSELGDFFFRGCIEICGGGGGSGSGGGKVGRPAKKRKSNGGKPVVVNRDKSPTAFDTAAAAVADAEASEVERRRSLSLLPPSPPAPGAAAVPPPSSGVLACFFCGCGNFSARAQLKKHMMNHYRQEIRETYFPGQSRGGRSGYDMNPCCPMPGCSYRAGIRANRLEHLTVHVGLTHRKIMNFIPEEEWPRVFGSSVGGARRSSSSAQSKATGGSEVREEEESKVNGEEEEMNDGGGEFSATLSKEEASLARQVSEEIKAAKKVKTNDTDPTESFEPPMLPVRRCNGPSPPEKAPETTASKSGALPCHLCGYHFDSFVDYKLHLSRLHFGASLRRDLAPLMAQAAGMTRDNKLGWQCKDPGCASASSGFPSSVALLNHLSVDHGRVMAYLSAEEKRRVTEAFAEGEDEKENVGRAASNGEEKVQKSKTEEK